MKLLITLLLASSMAAAAPSKEKSAAQEKMATQKDAVLVKANLKGLKIYGSMDLADSFDFDANTQNQSVSGTFGSEKAFGFGAKYTFTHLDNGIGIEGGGSYEMGRTISNAKVKNQNINYTGAKPEIQMWTVYGQATANLTSQFGVYAGGNYNFPQVKNISGGNWKGKFGYQVGGQLALSKNFSVNGELRTLNMGGSAEEQGVVTNYDNIRLQGFALRGLYAFE